MKKIKTLYNKIILKLNRKLSIEDKNYLENILFNY